MRMNEVESWGDGLVYYSQVLNPFGYIVFVTEDDPDYVEKAEHLAVGTAIFGLPLLGAAALSGGGASMPMYFGMGMPSVKSRALSVIGFKKQVYQGALTQSVRAAQGGVNLVKRHPGIFTALAAAGSIAYLRDRLHEAAQFFGNPMNIYSGL